MANRYIRHGATYCGDGTSKELATVNGGVGAWNDINVFSGSAPAYGTLPAGGTVYIRSLSASGDAVEITSGSGTTLGSSAATLTEQITWMIDGGSVWPGISGVVSALHTASAWMNMRAYNNFIAEVDCALTLKIAFEANNGIFAWINKCYTKGLCIDFTATPYSAPLNIFEESTHVNLTIKMRKMGAAPVYVQSSNTVVNLYNPTVLLNEVSINTSVFYTEGYGAEIRVYGGSISGPGATSGVRVFKSSSGGFMSHGLVYPKAMALSSADYLPSMEMLCFATGADGRLGTDFFDPFFSYTSRADLNPPTLNASFGDSANSGWSWKVHPYNVSVRKPAKLTTSKLYTQAASSKTVTQEFLWPTTLAAPTTDQVFMLVEYTDAATGVKVTQSTGTILPSAVAASSANWSSATWGAASFGKRKLAMTTQSSIKKDTEVMVTFFCATRSATTDDILFVCPDPTFS